MSYIIGRVLSTLVMLVVNMLAVRLPLNGMDTQSLSEMFSTLLTPAGFTFGIWSLIYICIILLTLGLVIGKIQIPRQTIVWYIISATANSLWIYARHCQHLHLALLCMLILLISLVMMEQTLSSQQSPIPYVSVVRGVILVYLGWILVATGLMITIYAQHQLKILAGYETLAAVCMIILIGLINICIIYKKHTIITTLVCIRALYGIISKQTDTAVIITVYISIAVLAITMMTSTNLGKGKLV